MRNKCSLLLLLLKFGGSNLSQRNQICVQLNSSLSNSKKFKFYYYYYMHSGVSVAFSS
jgi:hypothetical protein